MADLAMHDLDETGKVVLDNIYNEPDPRAYFSTLRELDYKIPQLAKPKFQSVLQAYRQVKGTIDTKIIDLGCSYGVNAALLKCDMEMGDLYGLYDEDTRDEMDRSSLIARDRKIFCEASRDDHLEIVGVDIAPQAAAYAEEVAIMDDTVVADLEHGALSTKHREALSDADLVISTGCIGYITERTIGKVLDANEASPPWMAHFVLRMFPFEPIQQALSERGYVTARGQGTYRQRRFASDDEREQVLDRLVDMGIDSSGYEADGWYYADFFLSRPVDDTDLLSSRELISP
jgi:carnitine O-acetyltransferase